MQPEQKKSNKTKEVDKDAHGHGVQVLSRLQVAAQQPGRRGKIPIDERPTWARNIKSILLRLSDQGLGLRALFEAGCQISSEKVTESLDFEAFKKLVSAMSNPGRRQVVAYARYLMFIEFVARLTGQDLTNLAGEICADIELDAKVSGLTERSISLAHQLRLIANRVGRAHDLAPRFQRIARLREAMLCAGGDCVWPDLDIAFESGDYTPRPGIRVGDAFNEYGWHKPNDRTIASKAKILEHPIDHLDRFKGQQKVCEMQERLLAHFVRKPQERRLAENTYYRAPDPGLEENQVPYSLEIVLAAIPECLGCLPLHYAGILVSESNMAGDVLLRNESEMVKDFRFAFSEPFLQSLHGSGSDFETDLNEIAHFTIFLYPDPTTEKLLPIAKIGCQEGSCVIALDAPHLNKIALWPVIAADRPRNFPYASESLLTYLERVIREGRLEADWERTVAYLDECPVYAALEHLRSSGVNIEHGKEG